MQVLDAQTDLKQRLPAKTIAFLQRRGASKAKAQPAATGAVDRTDAAHSKPCQESPEARRIGDPFRRLQHLPSQVVDLEMEIL